MLVSYSHNNAILSYTSMPGNEEGELIHQPICYGMTPDTFPLPKSKRRRREAVRYHKDIKEMLMSIWTNLLGNPYAM